MSGYLVKEVGGSSYLERVPADGTYGFGAGSREHATVFTYEAACELVLTLETKALLVEDPRPAQIGLTDLQKDRAA
jgi:hypothetical protein